MLTNIHDFYLLLLWVFIRILMNCHLFILKSKWHNHLKFRLSYFNTENDSLNSYLIVTYGNILNQWQTSSPFSFHWTNLTHLVVENFGHHTPSRNGVDEAGLWEGLVDSLKAKPVEVAHWERSAPLLEHHATGVKQQEAMFPTIWERESCLIAFSQRQGMFTAGIRENKKAMF